MVNLPVEVANALAWGIILIPLFGAIIACFWPRQLTRSFEKVSIACSLIAFLFALSLYPLVFQQNITLQTSFNWLLSGLHLRVDALGLFFALFTSLIWALVSFYNGPYLHSDDGYRRYVTTWLLALSANLGLVLAKDLFTFFIFFEILSLSAFFLIIHNQTEAAWQAGTKYLALSIGGGLLLLWGILLVYSKADSLQWTAIWQMQNISPFNWKLTLGLILAGLAVKAGLMPLHVWLPDAHPAAPTPASALLSGVMIKAGAYGMLRIAQGFIQVGNNSPWATQGNQIGFYLLWLGLISMLLGVTLALLQSNAKRLLAFHSISQMGYIVMGIGLCLYWNSADVLLGSLYHIFNHALFKSALFLVAGVIYWQSGEMNLKHLGGWAKSLPILFGCALIASAGISGLPPFNGYISKTILHVGLTEGTSLHFPGELTLMNTLFVLTGAGTLASFIKFITFIFIIDPKEKQKPPQPTPLAMQAPIIILSSLILLAGIFPHFCLKHLIGPALGPGFDLPEIHFWSLHELSGAGITIVLGSLLFGAAFYTKFFYHHWSAWPAVDYTYCRLGQTGLCIMRQVGNMSESFRAANLRWAEQAQIGYRQTMEQYQQGIQYWQQLTQKTRSKLSDLHLEYQEAMLYCQKLTQKIGSELNNFDLEELKSWWDKSHYDKLIQEEKHLEEMIETDITEANKWLKERLIKLADKRHAWFKKAESWLIKKGQKYQPLGLEEEITPADTVRYFFQYYNRDLGWSLMVILLVLMIFLFPLMTGWVIH